MLFTVHVFGSDFIGSVVGVGGYVRVDSYDVVGVGGGVGAGV